jgi:hypothetical protein
VGHQVSHLDIIPTILAGLDVPLPHGRNGLDLMQVAAGGESEDRPVLSMARRNPERLTDLDLDVPPPKAWDDYESFIASVRLPPYKLVDYGFLVAEDRRVLRHLVEDPGETQVMTDPGLTATLGRLIDQWWEENWIEDSTQREALSQEDQDMLRALGYID